MTTNAQQMTMSNDGETARCNVMFDDGHTEILVFDRPASTTRETFFTVFRIGQVRRGTLERTYEEQ